MSGSSHLEGAPANVHSRHTRSGDRRHDQHRRWHRLGLSPPGDRAHALLAAGNLPQAVHFISGKTRAVLAYNGFILARLESQVRLGGLAQVRLG